MQTVDDRAPPIPPPAAFRLWIAGYSGWCPTNWTDRPPLATALEPVSEATYSAEDARLFLEGFNSQMLRDARQLWVVAVPVALRFEGDLRPGDEIRGAQYALPSDDVPGLDAVEPEAVVQPDQGFSQSPQRSR